MTWLAATVRALTPRSMKSWFLVSVLIVFVVWNLYVRANADGVITGRVIDAGGAPVSGAAVALREKTLNYTHPPIETDTDDNGVFLYEDMDVLEFVIRAEYEDLRSEQQRYHLVFKKQRFELPEPLVLESQ